MNIPAKISLAALVLSTVSFAVSTTLYYRQRREKIRRQEALFTIERNAQFESNLIDWPGSFEIQGVDLKTAEAEGVRKDHIAYLVPSLNTLSSIALSNDMTVYETLQDKRYRRYRRQMFSNEITRKTWKYARIFFNENVQDGLDQYLREEYSSETDA